MKKFALCVGILVAVGLLGACLWQPMDTVKVTMEKSYFFCYSLHYSKRCITLEPPNATFGRVHVYQKEGRFFSRLDYIFNRVPVQGLPVPASDLDISLWKKYRPEKST